MTSIHPNRPASLTCLSLDILMVTRDQKWIVAPLSEAGVGGWEDGGGRGWVLGRLWALSGAGFSMGSA